MNTRNMEDDFKREVWCLLGLPFDAVDIKFAAGKIFQSSAKKKQCVISTPNLDFAVSALSDSDFRDTVITSELSLLDGMPLLWVARLLGLGVIEKVSGSDLFDFIWKEKDTDNGHLRLFFFGGEDGAAKSACENVNAKNNGVSCAGYLNPGFGSINLMSSQELINKINQTQADFLVVALGAKKGQQWINLNRTKLTTPVISHLGAVVNFVAARVVRAPRWMQKSGLEWLWRIYQEPLLWRRYLNGGLTFIKLLLLRVFPYLFWRKLNSRRLAEARSLSWRLETGADCAIIKIKGDCLHSNIGPLRDVFFTAAQHDNRIELELSDVSLIDGAFLGLCLLLLKHTQCCGGKLTISGVSSDLERIFYWNCADYLL